MAMTAKDIQNRELKDSVQELNKRISELLEIQKQKDDRIDELLRTTKEQKEQIDYLTRKLFGTSSEKIHDIEGQLGLFNEAELESDLSVPDFAEEETPAGTSSRKKATHKEQFKGVPVEEMEIDLKEDEKICPQCGTELVPVGKVFVREEFHFIPAKGKLIRYYAKTYKCPECTEGKNPGLDPYFVKAQVPEPLLENSFATESVVSWTMYQKCGNALPLYRQEKDWKSQGISISRTTLANWIIRTSERYFRPLYDYLHRKLLEREFLMADETRVQVLKEKDRSAETDSYMWLFRSGEDGLPPIVLYRYTETRAKYNAESFLKGFSGYLETDGYQGYNNLPDITRCCCWAHVRRYFFEAIPKGSELDMSEPAVQALQFIDKLFAVERVSKSRNHTFEQRYEFRLEKARPLLEAFWKWLDRQNPVKGSRFHKAVVYADNRRALLMNYLSDGRCSLSNNASENAIRPFTVGRKNWLFSDTPKGADASAMCYTLVELAKENNVNPLRYLNYVLKHRPDVSMTDDELEKLMPWSDAAIEACAKEME